MLWLFCCVYVWVEALLSVHGHHGSSAFWTDAVFWRFSLSTPSSPHIHRFMAPETLRSEVYPASDVWAAGVMAHQLLTGRFPFDDKSNPFSPSLSKVWGSILTDEVRQPWARGVKEAGLCARGTPNLDC